VCVCVCVCMCVSIKLPAVKYICRISILNTGNYPAHNIFYVSHTEVSTKSAAHYKKQGPSSGSNIGPEFIAFCGRQNSVISLKVGML
jgi:hypothetical protein